MSHMYREANLIESCRQIGQTGLSLRARVEKTVHELETHRLSGKERVPGAVVSKQGNADCLLGCKRTYHFSSR